ncbi:IS200/IS605 family transposase [Microbulbifer sp. GL-2]|uniref:IS200/IS605 family transposase n=1 Tax=Microbulbifer sp. GL-2 TaxID=2591606 RepID=UPI00155A78CF
MPRHRKKALLGALRWEIGEIFRNLCRQKGIMLVEGWAMKDHIHILLMIPPKFSVSNTVGFLKGKSGIQIFRK